MLISWWIIIVNIFDYKFVSFVLEFFEAIQFNKTNINIKSIQCKTLNKLCIITLNRIC